MASPRFSMRASRLTHQIQLQIPSYVRISSTAEPPKYDPVAVLSQPTWSVRSLLPQDGQQQQQQQPQDASTPRIPPSQLAHLLRLSALPSPTTESPSPPSQEPEAEAQEAQETQSPSPILTTLHAQLHFLRALQSIPLDKTTVPPLDAIRDETPTGRHESAITLTHPSIQAALANEEVYGRCRRPRRRGQSEEDRDGNGDQNGIVGTTKRKRKAGTVEQIKGVEDWDVLGGAGETVGSYFVVRTGGEGNIEGG